MTPELPSPIDPPTPPSVPDEPHPSSDDWVLRKASPLLGLSIIAGFAIGSLVGVVKDVPPTLAGIVIFLLGGRAALDKVRK